MLPNQWIQIVKIKGNAGIGEDAMETQKEYQDALFKAFRIELVVLLECLRFLHIENMAGENKI